MEMSIDRYADVPDEAWAHAVSESTTGQMTAREAYHKQQEYILAASARTAELQFEMIEALEDALKNQLLRIEFAPDALDVDAAVVAAIRKGLINARKEAEAYKAFEPTFRDRLAQEEEALVNHWRETHK